MSDYDERTSGELSRNIDALLVELRGIRDEMKTDRREMNDRLEHIVMDAATLGVRVTAVEDDVRTLYERAWWVASGAFAGALSMVATVLGWMRGAK